MKESLNSKSNSSLATDKHSSHMLRAEFSNLWAEAESLWDRHQNAPPFHGYVSADYSAVYETLVRLRGTATSILEWGSGLGIVTIMASRLGFEAYGIESEPSLVAHAQEFAKTYGPAAKFAQGSFIPSEFKISEAGRNSVCRTAVNIASAYPSLEMELKDFDLVYAYPWPAERVLYGNIMRDFGRRGARLLTYDARAGMEFIRFQQNSE